MCFYEKIKELIQNDYRLNFTQSTRFLMQIVLIKCGVFREENVDINSELSEDDLCKILDVMRKDVDELLKKKEYDGHKRYGHY